MTDTILTHALCFIAGFMVGAVLHYIIILRGWDRSVKPPQKPPAPH